MKIYGLTVVDTEGFGDGTESRSEVYKTVDERNKRAYELYKNEFEWAKEGEQLADPEDAELLAEETFIAEFEKDYVFIQRWDSHYQIESWQTDF